MRALTLINVEGVKMNNLTVGTNSLIAKLSGVYQETIIAHFLVSWSVFFFHSSIVIGIVTEPASLSKPDNRRRGISDGK